MSLLSALSGEMYTTWVWSSRSPVIDRRNNRSMHDKNADSVLPEPVGAAINVLRPAAISGQPSRWGSVGAPKRPANHSAISG
jgi:hypothetical protein